MKHSKKILITVVAILIVAVILAGCNMLRTDGDNSSNQLVEVEKAMTDNMVITIGDVKIHNDSTTTANVTITGPDLVAIYKKVTQDNPKKNLQVEEICTIVSNYANDPDYSIQRSTTAEVHREGDKWVLVSDECTQEFIADMAEKLLVQIISDLETFEIEAVEIGGTAK